MTPIIPNERNRPCPACRLSGADSKGDNLRIFPSGKFACIVNLRDKAHNRRILELCPELGEGKQEPTVPPVRRAKPATPFAWPPLEVGSDADLMMLSDLRDIDRDSLKMMSDRGLLRFACFREGRGYVVTDGSLKNAQARLLEGKAWPFLECKTRSPRSDRGAVHSWPIGLAAIEPGQVIALVEGVPDFLSVLHHAQELGDRVAPVMMAGASVLIHNDALAFFAGKRIRIFVHDDAAGAKAFASWSHQVQTAGAAVDGFAFDGLVQTNGEPVADLNDLCRIGPDSWEEHRDTVENCMNFAPEGK